MVTLTDAELLDLLRDGKEEGLRLIYRRYWQPLYNASQRRLNDAAQSEELVQDIFTDLWEKRAARVIDNLEAYLQTSVKYAVYRLYRKKQSLPFFEEPLEHMALEESSADSALFLKELRVFVDHWLEAQPEKRRELFRRRYLEDQGTEQISREMGVPQKTVQNTTRKMMVEFRSDMTKIIFLLFLGV